MEMEAFDEGILSKISVPEGGKAPVGSAIAILLEDGESEEATTPSLRRAHPPLCRTPRPPRRKRWNQRQLPSINHRPPPPLQPMVNASKRLRSPKRSLNPKVSILPLCQGPVLEVVSLKQTSLQLPLLLLPPLLRRQLPCSGSRSGPCCYFASRRRRRPNCRTLQHA
jgi:pyruvate/2-oxoglutarate dehydrogenase complex dihydrolipoamide acyltransferase (E2) component